jgi:soluble lytic murein transglycosylase
MTTRLPITRFVLALAVFAACRQEGPAVAVEAAELPAADTPKSPAPAAAPSRALWFAEGPGRDAILARERGDHVAARAHLEALLAGDATDDDRAAAELLLGLEDKGSDLHASAAQRFARARVAPGLSAIAPRIRLLEAQARLDAGEPAPALALVRELDPKALVGSPLLGDMLVIEADASLRTDDIPKARALYRKYLAEHPSGERRIEVTAKLARSLAKSDDAADLQAAADAFESLLLVAPLSEIAEDAERELARLRAAGHGKRGATLRELERQLAHARIEAMIDRGRYKQALKAADALLGESGIGPIDRCQAHFAKGTAVFKQRDRAKSRTHFEHAVTHCTSAGKPGVDMLVKATYQAGRGRYAEGKYGDAAKSFERLAKEHVAHSYADDAWVLAGESWAEGGEQERALAAWKQALAAAGDMAEEARRRLLVAAFARGDDAEALRLVDDGLTGKSLSPAERGKLGYFRGRALARTGDTEGARAAWLAVLTASPLDYPALQALSRLRELGDDAWAAGIAALVAATPSAPATPPTGASASALVLARLGLGDWAQDELRAADIDGWPAVMVLNQAGLYGGAQRLVGSMGTQWRSTPPKDDPSRWTAAHPQPFLEIIGPGETSSGVPQWLTYAIMQTESRFEPGATSFAGARGLVQLMPSTAKGVAAQVGIDLKNDDVLFDPSTNLALGMHHLGSLVARFGGGDGAVALAIPSYNAGAGAVEKWLDERGKLDLDVFIEAIPYDETRKYTQSVLGRWLAYRVLYGTAEDPRDRVPYLALPIKRGP